MSAPEPAVRPSSSRTPGRRIAAAVGLGVLIFLVLWIWMFSLVTSLLVATACCVVIGAASSVSAMVEMVLDAIAAVVFGILAVIGAIFAAIFGLFGF